MTKEQTDRMVKNMNEPWEANGAPMNLFLLLGSKGQEQVLEHVDTTQEHITEHESNKGFNLGIERSIQNFLFGSLHQQANL